MPNVLPYQISRSTIQLVKDEPNTYKHKQNIHMQNPHDKFFKQTFGNVTVARDFLHHYLPGHILQVTDLQSLKPEKETFIDQHLQEHFSDLLFQTKIAGNLGYLYFLFEHKSYPDKKTALQLLKYIVQIWEEKTNKQHQTTLPVIIPLVIYHGKNKWNIENSLINMIVGYRFLSDELRRYIPNYQYLLFDLTNFSDEEMKGSLELKAYLTICRDILSDDTIVFMNSIFRALEFIQKITDDELRIKYMNVLFTYIYNARKNFTQKEVEQIMKKIPEGSEAAMTLAELYRKEGEQKGIEKGIEQKAQQIAEKLLLKGYSMDEIIELTELSREEIENIKKKI